MMSDKNLADGLLLAWSALDIANCVIRHFTCDVRKS